MHIRDRIQDFRRVKAKLLRPHPRNWRTHPQAQQDVMRGVLAEIGYADALLARELPDGSLQLIDGHLRAEVTPDALVPVLIVDLTDAEALKLLALLDPLSAMAGTDSELLRGLVDEVQTDNASIRAMLDELASAEEILIDDDPKPLADAIIPATFQVVVACHDESEQHTVYERLTGEGFKCRVQSL